MNVTDGVEEVVMRIWQRYESPNDENTRGIWYSNTFPLLRIHFKMLGLMINGCVTTFQFLQKHSECSSTEVMESTRGRVKGFGKEMMIVAA